MKRPFYVPCTGFVSSLHEAWSSNEHLFQCLFGDITKDEGIIGLLTGGMQAASAPTKSYSGIH